MKEYLKVKFKSLSAEARIIRLEERKAKARRKDELRYGLYAHRVNLVRPEARATHLARGFLRGTPYRSIEQITYSDPDWKKVQSMIEKYGDGDARDLRQQFSEWRDAA